MTRHYIVNAGITLTAGNLNDFVQLQPGGCLNLVGGTVNKNIWGPGNTTISGNVTMNADMGVAPASHALSACQVVYVTSNMTV